MELTPLPLKEKATVAQKRAAQRQAKETQQSHTHTQSRTQTQPGAASGGAATASGGVAGNSNASYILTTTLPPRYRTPLILSPSSIPTPSSEASYTGFVTFLISLILLSPGQVLSDAQLEKHLRRMNSEDYVPISTHSDSQPTETVLKRMIREGYIVKVKERDETVGGEERVEWIVGPRGRVEVGEKGVAGVVRGVFRKRDGEGEELERRLVRSLGMGVGKPQRRDGGGEGEGQGGERQDGEGEGNGVGGGEEDEEGEGQQRTRATRAGGRSQTTYSGTARGGRGAAARGNGRGNARGRGRGRPTTTRRQEADVEVEVEDEDEDEESDGDEDGESEEEE